MFPESFIRRIRSQEYIDSEALLKALEEPSPSGIRINTGKWEKTPLNAEAVPWCCTGYYPDSRPSYTADPMFHAGCYYPQEASGMFVEEIFRQVMDSCENIRVLDLCGAPGGKSTHLSSLIGQNGFLVANEVIRSRASILAENITKWGMSNAIVSQDDPAAFGNLPGFFDLILVDAPCSGEGMFRDQTAVEEWSPENAARCSVRQKRILMDVWPALKEGGFLIYSTCTFNPDENEKNIKWLVQNAGCEPVRINISGYKGITEIEYEGIYGYGFYPGLIKGEGLFYSVLRKTDKSERISSVSKSGRRLKVTVEEEKIACEWTNFRDSSLIRTGDDLVSIPCTYDDYLSLSGALKIVKTGTCICAVKAKNFVPSHELAMSVFFNQESFPADDPDLMQALSYLCRGLFVPDNAVKGWNIVKYNGIPLGFVNNIGSRINNYYPVGWRIRMDVSKGVNLNILKWNP